MSIVFLCIVNLVCLAVVLCMVCIVTVYVTTSVCLSASHDKQLLDAENKELKRTSPVSTHILHRG